MYGENLLFNLTQEPEVHGFPLPNLEHETTPL